MICKNKSTCIQKNLQQEKIEEHLHTWNHKQIKEKKKQ
jgi:hypothetical protein